MYVEAKYAMWEGIVIMSLWHQKLFEINMSYVVWSLVIGWKVGVEWVRDYGERETNPLKLFRNMGKNELC